VRFQVITPRYKSRRSISRIEDGAHPGPKRPVRRGGGTASAFRSLAILTRQ